MLGEGSGGTAEEIAGTVAAPGRKGRTPFHSFGELKTILLQGDTDEAPPSEAAGPEKSK